MNYLLNAYHGIEIKKQLINGLLPSEASAVIKSIYHLCLDEYDGYKLIYIGYSNDINILQMLNKAGFGHLAVNVKNMFESNPPSNSKIMEMCHHGKGVYSPCNLHDCLANQFTYNSRIDSKKKF